MTIDRNDVIEIIESRFQRNLSLRRVVEILVLCSITLLGAEEIHETARELITPPATVQYTQPSVYKPDLPSFEAGYPRYGTRLLSENEVEEIQVSITCPMAIRSRHYPDTVSNVTQIGNFQWVAPISIQKYKATVTFETNSAKSVFEHVCRHNIKTGNIYLTTTPSRSDISPE